MEKYEAWCPQTSIFSSMSWRHRYQWLCLTPTPECIGAKLTILGKHRHYMKNLLIMCLPSKNCRSQLFLSFISIAFHWAQKHIEQSWPVNEDKHAISEVLIFFYFSLWLLYDYKYVDFEENDKYPLDIRSTGLSGVRAHLEIDTNCVWTSSLGYISFPDKPSEIIKDILSKFIQVITSNRYWK